ncbi:hypothetical protein Q5W_12750 [Hydrogenophaga sp. PBC]|nr:hypothetical protein Q5W_12750 [Hydrogenophaga sp. PBC]
MIAANFRKFPEAMALQLVLIFGRCTWHTARPTTRLGRAQRAERSRLVKETPQVVRWVPKTVPVWWRLAQKAARALAKAVKAAMLPLVWDQAINTDLQEPVDAMAQLYAARDRFQEEHEDAYSWGVFTRRLRSPTWLPVWEHFGVGGGFVIAESYRG